LMTASGARVIVRPSGTEPKVKAYLEVVRPMENNVERSRAEAEAAIARIEADVQAFLLPEA